MRHVLAVLALFAVQVSASEVLGAGASPTAGPRVVFGIDAKAGQRYLQLTERGPAYPTALPSYQTSNNGWMTFSR